MAKTDKELTVELVNNYISSWNNSSNTTPANKPDFLSLLKDVHKVVKELDQTESK